MRIVVVKQNNGDISCLPMSQSKEHYENKYNVVCYVNKLCNPYYISIIKKYFG